MDPITTYLQNLEIEFFLVLQAKFPGTSNGKSDDSLVKCRHQGRLSDRAQRHELGEVLQGAFRGKKPSCLRAWRDRRKTLAEPGGKGSRRGFDVGGASLQLFLGGDHYRNVSDAPSAGEKSQPRGLRGGRNFRVKPSFLGRKRILGRTSQGSQVARHKEAASGPRGGEGDRFKPEYGPAGKKRIGQNLRRGGGGCRLAKRPVFLGKKKKYLHGYDRTEKGSSPGKIPPTNHFHW